MSDTQHRVLLSMRSRTYYRAADLAAEGLPVSTVRRALNQLERGGD